MIFSSENLHFGAKIPFIKILYFKCFKIDDFE